MTKIANFLLLLSKFPNNLCKHKHWFEEKLQNMIKITAALFEIMKFTIAGRCLLLWLVQPVKTQNSRKLHFSDSSIFQDWCYLVWRIAVQSLSKIKLTAKFEIHAVSFPIVQPVKHKNKKRTLFIFCSFQVSYPIVRWAIMPNLKKNLISSLEAMAASTTRTSRYRLESWASSKLKTFETAFRSILEQPLLHITML